MVERHVTIIHFSCGVINQQTPLIYILYASVSHFCFFIYFQKSPDEVPESEQQVDSQSLLVAMQEEMAKIGDLVKSCNDHKDVLKQEHRDIARLINADKPVLGRLDEQVRHITSPLI